MCGGKLKRQKKRSEEQNASSKKHTTMNRCLKKAELKYLYHMSKKLWDFSLYIPINGSHKLLLSCCSWLSTMELASLRRNGAKHKSRCSRRFSDNATRENHSSVCYTWKPGSPANGHRHLHQKDGLVCLSHEVDLQKIVQCRFALVFSSQWFQETLASDQLRVSLHSCKRVCAVLLMVESSSCTAADRSCALRLCWLILAQSLATVEHGRGAAALGWSATSGAGELSQVVERWLSVHGNFERFGDEVCSRLGLLYMVALHDLTLFVETQVPASARLLLPIDHWRVGHVIVLKHWLFEFALWREVLRGVQVAFIVHGQIELGLDTLYSHHSQPNGDEVENSIAIIFLFCTIDGPISLEL